MRERILNCLSSLSELVGGTKSDVLIYYEDQTLWDNAQELYDGILEGVEIMTEWLVSSAYSNNTICRVAMTNKEQEERLEP